MPPIIKTKFPTDNVPWEKIDQDFIDSNFLDKPGSAGTGNIDTTYFSHLRRDLEPWAEGFRNHLLEIVCPLLHWARSPTWNDLVLRTWMNRYRKTGGTVKHTHRWTELAVVWYLKAEDGAANFVYEHNDRQSEIPVMTGDILIFPGDLPHLVKEQLSDDSRIIMATNLSWTYRFIDKVSIETFDKILSSRLGYLHSVLSSGND